MKNSRPIIISEIDWLKTQQAELMKELEIVKLALTTEENKLDKLPTQIEQMEEDLKTAVKKTRHLHKRIQPISGSATADQQEIDEVDQIRLHALNVVQKFI